MLNYQGVDADVVSSAIDRYATTTESQENTPSDHGTLETMSFTTSLLTGQQQVLTKLVPDDLRIRRAEELQQNFLKILHRTFFTTGGIIAIDRAKIFRLIPFIVCLRHVIILCSRWDASYLINRYKFSCLTSSDALQSVGVGLELSFFKL